MNSSGRDTGSGVAEVCVRRHSILFVFSLLALAALACGPLRLPSLPRLATPTPAPTVTPVIMVVTATPDPLAVAAGADLAEERVIRVYEQASPAVVNITSRVVVRSFFFSAYPEEGSGSGFVWDAQGHIVTNYHVVENADSLAVNFGDDNAVRATVVGTDPHNDLAVILVDTLPAGVEPLVVGDSSTLRVGQTAIAIGNPFGQFERTLTTGVVSALNRTIETDSQVLRGAIQTDASINRGNSGGPLLDSLGRLIGVNSAIFSPSGTSAGVGFAIPANTVKKVVPVLIERGRFPHPWLGAIGYDITPRLAQQLSLPVEQGLLVAQLYEGSPALQAGVQGARREVIVGNRRMFAGGDIITAIDEQPLRAWKDLDAYLEAKTEVGQGITLHLLREGQAQTITIELAEEPPHLP
ncbi:MAG: trypsin-like peptidase domain-containing protein [Anaerolineae bacterium]